MFQVPYNPSVVDWYVRKQKEYCEKKIKEFYKNLTENKYHEKNPKSIYEFLRCIEKNLDTILRGKPKMLYEISEEIQARFPEAFHEPPKKSKKEDYPLYYMPFAIFNYDTFTDSRKDFAYELTRKLDVSICPYCNREFIFTVEIPQERDTKKKCIIRPELDHYYPQSKFPLLALSFFNLIPSGHICNSNIKHDKELDFKSDLHPYVESKARIVFIAGMKAGEECEPPKTVIDFDAVPMPDLTGRTLSNAEQECLEDDKRKAKHTFDFFKLGEIYQHHSHVAERIEEIFRKYPPEMLYNAQNGNEDKKQKDAKERPIIPNLTKEEMLRILFSEFIIKEPDREILGCLKSDLYHAIEQRYKEKWAELDKSKSGKASMK